MSERPTPAQLLEQARAGHQPGVGDEERVRAALHQRLLANPLLLTGKGAHTAAGVSKLAGGKLVMVVSFWGGLGALGALVASRYVDPHGSVLGAASVRHSESAPGALQGSPPAVSTPFAGSVEPRSASATPPRPPFSPSALVLPAAVPGPSSPSASSRSAPLPAVSSPSAQAFSGSAPPVLAFPALMPSGSAALSAHDLRSEISALSRAQELLHGGQPALALSALDQIAVRFPGGALLEERDATRTLSLCALGRSASAAAQAFLARYPRSVHAAQVRAACGLSD